jgi:hypothetical protein
MPRVGIYCLLVGDEGRTREEQNHTRVMISMKRQKAKKIPKSIASDGCCCLLYGYCCYCCAIADCDDEELVKVDGIDRLAAQTRGLS